MGISILVLTVAFYAAVATAYLEARRRREAPPRWARIAGPLTVGIHLLGLILLSAETQRSPFANGSQALSFLAFSLVALYLVLEATSRVATHGGGFYVLAALFAAIGVPGLVEGGAAAGGTPPDAGRSLHVGFALMSSAAVLASGLLAAGYLGAYRRVKKHRLGPGAQGPSLTGFERLARRASLLGVLLLGPALFLGSRIATRSEDPGSVWFLVLTMGVPLVLLAAAFLIWWRRPLRGVTAAWLNLAGTATLFVAFGLMHPVMMRVGL